MAENRLGFLRADVWLDEDGRHVWLAHDCVDGRETTMLPTTWKADEAGKVTPSIACIRCGLHFFGDLTFPPSHSQTEANRAR